MQGKVEMQITDIGEIPVAWGEPRPIKELFDTYPTASVTRDELSDEGNVFCIHYGDIHTKFGAIVDANKIALPATNDSKYLRYTKIKEGDLIIADTSEDYDGVGKGISVIGVEDKHIIAGLHTLPLRDKDDNFDTKFLGYYFSTDIIKSQLESKAVGTKVYSISYNSIGDCLIPVPPKDEQTRIAKALSEMDDLIISLDELIEKKTAIKQGAMQKLLSGETRLKGYSGEWVEKKMQELGSVFNGITGKSKNDFGEGPSFYVTFLNVLTNPIIDCTQLEKVNIIREEGQNMVKINDLCFNVSSETPEEVGICASMQDDVEDVYLNSFCFGFRLKENEEVDSLFLAYFFRTEECRDLMASIAQGATRYNLSKENFYNIVLTVPPTKKEQKAIAQVLTDMTDEITQLEAERDKYKLIREGMAQQLLTGKIRLI